MRVNLLRWPLLGLLVVLGLPALAQAQLFPNLPIRRERQDCSHENPQFKMIRQEYWGYYPTCWRKFPAGWGCPAPEPPDWEASKRKLPLVPPEPLDPDNAAPEDGGDPMEPKDGAGAERPRANQPAKPGDIALPPVPPEGTSPFDNVPKPPDTGRPAGNPPADPPPGVDPPKGPGASTSEPLGELPKTTAAPARRRTIVAGFLERRKR